MKELTKKQRQIFDFVRKAQESGLPSPTLREIAAHFGFNSPKAAADHLDALKRKGMLQGTARKSRSLRVVSQLGHFRKRVLDIPLYGTIPAGFAENQLQAAEGCVSIDVATLGMNPTAQAFALKVTGDSMIGKHICAGDLVILEPGITPRHGAVVAALIDNDSTLKTFVADKKKPHLKAENPKYPKLYPINELTIQGVMVALIRQAG